MTLGKEEGYLGTHVNQIAREKGTLFAHDKHQRERGKMLFSNLRVNLYEIFTTEHSQ